MIEEGWYYFNFRDALGYSPGYYKLKRDSTPQFKNYLYKIGKYNNLPEKISYNRGSYYEHLLELGKIRKLTDDEMMIKDIIE